MAQPSQRKVNTDDLTKKQLQREMDKTREAVAETVSEIKQTVGKQYQAARETVAGVLDYREQFQNEPLVWSLGALSAGFALGYTMGYAHKETRGARKKSEIAKFTDSLVDELSVVGKGVVMPTLNVKIKELFGFDFEEVLQSIGDANTNSRKRKVRRKPKAIAKSTKRRKKVVP
jgi:hypothetical protein